MVDIQFTDAKELPKCPKCGKELDKIEKMGKQGFLEQHIAYMCPYCKVLLSVGYNLTT